MPDVSFQQVADVAGWLQDELEPLAVPHFLKTSGASRLPVCIPLGPRTSFRQAWQFCELLGRVVARKRSREATIERSVTARGKKFMRQLGMLRSARFAEGRCGVQELTGQLFLLLSVARFSITRLDLF